MSARLALAAAAALALALPAAATARPRLTHRPTPAASQQAAATQAAFDGAVRAIEALPYQPAYLPLGRDTAFPGLVLNSFPVEDYTTGSIPLLPDTPAWPPAFEEVRFHSADGAPLIGMLALQPGAGPHPAVVVAHGFNTHGKLSVIRWAAMLYARGYDVIAADQRDYDAEFQAGEGYPRWLQTLGWKESQDILAAGRLLRSRPGVASVGLLGFSEGAQDAVLAASGDAGRTFDAVLTFSGPADQNTEIASNPTGSGALVALVVPPQTFTDACTYLDYAARRYATTPWAILSKESAMHAQQGVTVPLLNVYAQDDPLVPSAMAQMMAAYERDAPLQRTLEVRHGLHAYFLDRWWQQAAVLRYFHALLPAAGGAGTAPTVNRTPGGAPFADQEVRLGGLSRAGADAQLAPYVCDGHAPPPGEPGA